MRLSFIISATQLYAILAQQKATLRGLTAKNVEDVSTDHFEDVLKKWSAGGGNEVEVSKSVEEFGWESEDKEGLGLLGMERMTWSQSYSLHIIDIKCIDQNDSFGDDEIELLKEGKHFWPDGKKYEDMSTEDTKPINKWVGLDKPVKFTFKEHDWGWTIPGTVDFIFNGSSDKGGTKKIAIGKHTHYEIKYEIKSPYINIRVKNASRVPPGTAGKYVKLVGANVENLSTYMNVNKKTILFWCWAKWRLQKASELNSLVKTKKTRNGHRCGTWGRNWNHKWWIGNPTKAKFHNIEVTNVGLA